MEYCLPLQQPITIWHADDSPFDSEAKPLLRFLPHPRQHNSGQLLGVQFDWLTLPHHRDKWLVIGSAGHLKGPLFEVEGREFTELPPKQPLPADHSIRW